MSERTTGSFPKISVIFIPFHPISRSYSDTKLDCNWCKSAKSTNPVAECISWGQCCRQTWCCDPCCFDNVLPSQNSLCVNTSSGYSSKTCGRVLHGDPRLWCMNSSHWWREKKLKATRINRFSLLAFCYAFVMQQAPAHRHIHSKTVRCCSSIETHTLRSSEWERANVRLCFQMRTLQSHLRNKVIITLLKE